MPFGLISGVFWANTQQTSFRARRNGTTSYPIGWILKITINGPTDNPYSSGPRMIHHPIKEWIPGPLGLLILQPTPFCNIDCAYCYLTTRNSRRVMSRDILEKCFARLFEFPFLAETVTLVWHSGEPLVVPLEFYRVATILAQNANERGVQLRQNIQTNTMLLTQDWCDFIKLNRVEVGISIDGPDFVHDRYRVRRSGRGTHTQVMRGINLLRRNDIQFSAID